MPPEQVIYVDPPQQQSQNRHFKLWAILVVVVSILLFVLQWVSNQAYLDITVQGQGTGTATYELVNQADREKRIEFSTDATTIKKRVPKGTYELTTRRGDANAFSITKAGGFFATTEVTAKAEAEKGRRFVGHSPKSCMYWLGDSMVSYSCGGLIESFITHVPASSQLPTRTQPYPFPTEDALEGLVSTKEGDVLIMYEAVVAGHEEFAEEGGKHSPHVAFLLKDGLKLQFEQRTQLTDIPETERVSVLSFKDGFLTYNEQFQNMRYYPSVKSKPESIQTPKPENTNLSPYEIATGGNLVVLAYNEAGNSDNPGKDSVVMVQDEGQTREYDFSRTFEIIKVCGTNKLCGVSDGTLYMYDVGGKEAEQLLALGDVRSIENYKGGFAVARSNGILNFDLDKQEGNLQYSFGDNYRFCGLQPVKDTYVVCTTFDPDNRNQLSMLYIEQNQTNDDNIDKKVAELWKSEQIGGLTIYGKYIYITANTGTTPVYNVGPGDFGYYPDAVQRATSKIRLELSKVGIDQKKYTVKITGL